MNEDDLRPFVNIVKFLFILVAGILACKLIASCCDFPSLKYNFDTDSWELSRKLRVFE